MVSLEQLKRIYPKLALQSQRLTTYYPLLIDALEKAGITTKPRLAAFLAQVGHESDEFRYMSEVWGPTEQQLRYDPPTKLAARLGNTKVGDGYRYRGAGPIQITGRENFRKAGKDLGADLENHPELAFTPAMGFRLAAWFWDTRGLNTFADRLVLDPAKDAETFDHITRGVNGGLNGKEGRDAYYARACKVLR